MENQSLRSRGTDCEEKKSEKPIWRRLTAGTEAETSEVSCTDKQARKKHLFITAAKVTPAGPERGEGKNQQYCPYSLQQ